MPDLNHVTYNLLKNYSQENHSNRLYDKINKIEWGISPIVSDKWIDEQWTQVNEIPHVAISHLLDSYYCLPERPDMAFTFIWKSINNIYREIGQKVCLANNLPRLSDSDGITYLVEQLDAIKSHRINSTTTISDLFTQYLSLIPTKPLKFLSNIILKGYSAENAQIPSVLNSSSYFTFKKKYDDVAQKILATYGEAYRNITNPTLTGTSINLNVTDLQKSKSIPESLAKKLYEIIVNGTTSVSTPTNSTNQTSYQIMFVDEKEKFDFVIRMLLYSIRNNSVHGHIGSRLNSHYLSDDSLKSSIYIYLLGHFVLSLSLYANNKLSLTELGINIQNLSSASACVSRVPR